MGVGTGYPLLSCGIRPYRNRGSTGGCLSSTIHSRPMDHVLGTISHVMGSAQSRGLCHAISATRSHKHHASATAHSFAKAWAHPIDQPPSSKHHIHAYYHNHDERRAIYCRGRAYRTLRYIGSPFCGKQCKMAVWSGAPRPSWAFQSLPNGSLVPPRTTAAQISPYPMDIAPL